MTALRAEWLALWRRCPDATPFQSPHWLIPWAKHLARGELRVLSLRLAGRLAGVLPFLIHEPGGAAPRELLLLGTGISDYLDLLLEPGAEEPGLAALLEFLQAGRGEWDRCDFQALRPGSPLLRLEPPPGWTGRVERQEVCPVLPLPETLEQLPRAVPSRMLAKLRYYRRRLAALPDARIEPADPANFSELFEHLFQLHERRWAGRGQHGVLAAPGLQAFHREAAWNFLQEGVLRFYALRLSGLVIAFLCCYSHGARVFYYLGGFDPEFASLSPGTLLIGHAIEEAIRQGAREFDFLRGPEPYKYHWGTADQEVFRRQLRPPP